MSIAVSQIFDEVQRAAAATQGTIFLVTLSFVELYNDEFRDLLSDYNRGANNLSASTSCRLNSTTHATNSMGGGCKVELKSNGDGGYEMTGSRSLRTPITSVEEAMDLISYGNSVRTTGRTNLNEHSSRSHAILTIVSISDRCIY